jgi:tungstate transport system substrate-binding protein
MYHLENKEQWMSGRIIRTLHKASLWLVLCLTGVSASGADTSFIRLATTTSTENSGLLKVLLPAFEKNHNYRVKVISVGTGKALRLAREGDVDVVLVHAREAEDKLVADGYGVDRRDVMYNDFVLVGSTADPAGIRGTTDAADAFSRIAASGSLFVSRGDSSGTHKKELQLWQQAGTAPRGQWYREAGQGMGKVLQIAGELEAYTLTDRGTWLAYRNKLPLVIVTEGDKRLFNPYGIIAANPAKYPDLNYEGAKALIDWIISPAAQKMIGDFTIDQQRLFVPMHDPLEPDGNP